MSYGIRKSTWNSGVWKAIRRESAGIEVCKHWDHVTGAWKQMGKQSRRVDISYDLSTITALRHLTWPDDG